MPKLLRPQTYPYASSSTGQYRGLLGRKYPCWEAQGYVRDVFTKEIAGKIKTCLEQCLPESNSFIGFSLFMVGKLEKTKPTIMIVSDDKPRRKAAFQVIKSKNILAAYPGFELGHCSVAAEFEDLRQLGSDSTASTSSSASTESYESIELDDGEPGTEVLSLLSAEACAFETLDAMKPTRLYFHMPSKLHSHCSASATCGGLLRYQDGVYALTMAHAIHPIRCAIISPEPHSDSSSESDDFEITGLDDWGENDEEDVKTLTVVTSPGSKTSSEFSDSEDSLLRHHNSRLSSEISIRTRIATGPSVIYEEDFILDDYEDDDDVPAMCEQVGSVVSVDQEFDIALIKTTLELSKTKLPLIHSIKDLFLGDGLTTASITVKTTHHPEIRGQCSLTPFYTRLPGTRNFLELHGVKLSTPVCPGDSGSWAFNDKGEFAGLIVAGNPQTGSCLLLPSRAALGSAYSLLMIRKWPPIFGLTPLRDSVQQTGPIPLEFGSPIDEDANTVASSFPSSTFSHIEIPSAGPQSTTMVSYKRIPGASYGRESLLRADAGPTSSSVPKGDFLEGQVARMRRELERAWEIIREKDKELQQFLIGSGDSFQVMKTERAMDHTSIETTRALWQEEVKASTVLDQENKELKRGIKQAIDAIHQVHGDRKQLGDRQALLKIASDLSRISTNSDDGSGPSPRVGKAKAEPETNDTFLKDFPQLSHQIRGAIARRPSLSFAEARNQTLNRNMLKRIFWSRDLGSSLYDISTAENIFPVLEVDEEYEEDEYHAIRTYTKREKMRKPSANMAYYQTHDHKKTGKDT
ncbi:hypothetical protein F4825DRAFT_476716 [Nemania diffusa]|nr:hypothetical protein F4825DRAFT_476716 [Nemania diffusa]